jgi:hypothetical protein
MDTDTKRTRLKWYHPYRLGLTGEYCAGILGGFGLGLVVMALLARDFLAGSGWGLVIIPGFAMIALGSGIQHHILQRRARNGNTDD